MCSHCQVHKRTDMYIPKHTRPTNPQSDHGSPPAGSGGSRPWQVNSNLTAKSTKAGVWRREAAGRQPAAEEEGPGCSSPTPLHTGGAAVASHCCVHSKAAGWEPKIAVWLDAIWSQLSQFFFFPSSFLTPLMCSFKKKNPVICISAGTFSLRGQTGHGWTPAANHIGAPQFIFIHFVAAAENHSHNQSLESVFLEPLKETESLPLSVVSWTLLQLGLEL